MASLEARVAELTKNEAELQAARTKGDADLKAAQVRSFCRGHWLACSGEGGVLGLVAAS